MCNAYQVCTTVVVCVSPFHCSSLHYFGLDPGSPRYKTRCSIIFPTLVKTYQVPPSLEVNTQHFVVFMVLYIYAFCFVSTVYMSKSSPCSSELKKRSEETMVGLLLHCGMLIVPSLLVLAHAAAAACMYSLYTLLILVCMYITVLLYLGMYF